MLAKIVAIAISVWFYKSAQKIGENPIQWAVLGVIGFFLSATLAHYAISEPLLGTLPPQGTLTSLIRQSPLLIGIASVYFIYKKHLLKNQT